MSSPPSVIENEDSDLEILPNPNPAPSHLVDLSLNDDNNIHLEDVYDNVYNERQTTTNNERKRTIIKCEDDCNEPALKRRRLNSNNTDNEERINNIKQEVEKCVNVNDHRVKNIGKNSYHFWTAHPGLYYAGNCLNNECMAFNEPVTTSRGYGIIKPIFDVKQKSIKCPGCSTHFELKGIRLYQCSATITYQLLDDDEQTIKEIPTIQNGTYIEFGDIVGKLITTNNKNHSSNKTTNINNQQNKYQNMYKLLSFNVRR